MVVGVVGRHIIVKGDGGRGPVERIKANGSLLLRAILVPQSGRLLPDLASPADESVFPTSLVGREVIEMLKQSRGAASGAYILVCQHLPVCLDQTTHPGYLVTGAVGKLIGEAEGCGDDPAGKLQVVSAAATVEVDSAQSS